MPACELWVGGAAAAAEAAAAVATAVVSGGAHRIVPATPWVTPLVHVRLTPEEVVVKEGVTVTEAGTQPLRCSLHAAQHPRRSPLLRRWAALPIRQNPSTAAAATETAKAAAAAAPGTGGTKAGAATSAIAAVSAAAVTAASSGGGASAAAVLHQYHFDSCARVGPEGALLSTSVPALHAIDGYLVFNLFRLTPASADRLRGGTTARPTRQSLRATPA